MDHFAVDARLMYGLTDKRLDSLLDIWSEWMRGESDGKGFGTQSHIEASNSSQDFDQLCDEMEYAQARAMDVCIEDLPRNERASVHHMHLAAIWQFRDPLEEIYGRAREMLCTSLQKRGIE